MLDNAKKEIERIMKDKTISESMKIELIKNIVSTPIPSSTSMGDIIDRESNKGTKGPWSGTPIL